MPTFSWFAHYASMAQAAALAGDEYPIEIGQVEIPPAPKPGPEIPWECHNPRKVDPERAWEAVLIACKGQGA